jgi:RNA polymerase sigma factor (TIGR02999 family)
MPDTAAPDITELLDQWGRGEKDALEKLAPVVYQELRKRARGYFRRERSDHTLQPTALIHEAYMRLVRQESPGWKSRTHFFAVASQMMRQILVDHARTHNAAKRGGGAAKVSLDEGLAISEDRSSEILAVDEALRKLADFDSRKARIVELRYFSGFTVEETAEALGVAPITVLRESRVAEAWLRRAMTGESPAADSRNE